MINGLWSVQFSSSSGSFGGGIVVFQNGKVYGGDLGYYYIGSYKIEDDLISGEVAVANYSGAPHSVFGPINNFKLVLSGKVHSTNMTLNGNLVGQPNMTIGIQCTKRAEIS